MKHRDMSADRTSCMLYVHKHRDTSPRDVECGRAQYDDEGVRAEHDTRGSVDFQTSLQTASLTERVQGYASPLGIHTHTCGSYVGKYYTFIVV